MFFLNVCVNILLKSVIVMDPLSLSFWNKENVQLLQLSFKVSLFYIILALDFVDIYRYI